MVVTRPSSDLRNQYNEISEYCHFSNEPVSITENGVDDLVVLSVPMYERITGKLELHKLLDEGIAAMESENYSDANEFMDELDKEFLSFFSIV